MLKQTLRDFNYVEPMKGKGNPLYLLDGKKLGEFLLRHPFHINSSSCGVNASIQFDALSLCCLSKLIDLVGCSLLYFAFRYSKTSVSLGNI